MGPDYRHQPDLRVRLRASWRCPTYWSKTTAGSSSSPPSPDFAAPPYAAPYAASKHGLIGLMRSLASEFAKSPMTVNAVCPAFVDTPMVDDSAARIARVSKRSEEEARGVAGGDEPAAAGWSIPTRWRR